MNCDWIDLVEDAPDIGESIRALCSDESEFNCALCWDMGRDEFLFLSEDGVDIEAVYEVIVTHWRSID